MEVLVVSYCTLKAVKNTGIEKLGQLTAACPEGWWIMMREFGRECRMPGLPAVSSREAMLAAWPTHHVATGGRTYCIVSYIPRPAVTEPPKST